MIHEMRKTTFFDEVLVPVRVEKRRIQPLRSLHGMYTWEGWNIDACLRRRLPIVSIRMYDG